MSELRLQNAAFSYGKEPVFSDLSFVLPEGKTMAVLGPNGAGKTTLLRCLLTLLPLQAGEVLLDGRDLSLLREKERFRAMSYVPQKQNLPTSYTVLETVLLGRTGEIGIFSMPSEKDVREAETVLETLGIADLSGRRCDSLSGGEIQMVLIARALVKRPSILVLDEPESGLDFRNQLVVLSVIEKLRERKISCVFNTHYPEHAFSADYALLLSGGRGIFGKTADVVTDENIQRIFSVESLVTEVSSGGTTKKIVIPFRVKEPEDQIKRGDSDDKEEEK